MVPSGSGSAWGTFHDKELSFQSIKMILKHFSVSQILNSRSLEVMHGVVLVAYCIVYATRQVWIPAQPGYCRSLIDGVRYR